MSSRISRDELNISICDLISKRSKCFRANVGCVITVDNRIVATGYNSPLNHSCEGICDISNACRDSIHAEANAISFSARHGISLGGATLYCNYSPCYECAKLIIQAGIKHVVYQIEYRVHDGLELLSKNHVSSIQYEQEKSYR